jgi:hypothetical protein
MGILTKRARRGALRWWVVVGALAATLILVAGVAFANTKIDLAIPGVEVEHNGALLAQVPPGDASGTGVFNPFLHIKVTGQSDGIEKGYNTDDLDFQYDQVKKWTTSLLLSDVPVVSVEIDSTQVAVREFYLDINEPAGGGEEFLSVDELQFYLAGGDSASLVDLHDPGDFPTPFPDLGDEVLVWDLDVPGDFWVNLDFTLGPGSGKPDMAAYIPDSLFVTTEDCSYGSTACDTYVILYTLMGATEPNDGQFEEWNTKVRPIPSTIMSITADPLVVHSGDEVTWTVTEENDGEVALTNPTVDLSYDGGTTTFDTLSAPPLSGDANTDGILDPGETWTWEYKTSPTADVTITATGHGLDPATGLDVTFPTDPDERDSASVDVINPSTVVTLSVLPTKTHSGDEVTWTVTEENDGDVALTNPFVNLDAVLGASEPKDDGDVTTLSAPPLSGDANTDGILDPGETWTWEYKTSPTADVTLYATGHGTDPLGTDITFAYDADERDSASVDVVRFEGLTPGYWKNHLDDWPPTGYSPEQKVKTVFDRAVGPYARLGNAELIEALEWPAGNEVDEKAQVLLHHATAAVLNAAHPNISYPMLVGDIVAAVNAALDLGDPQVMLDLKDMLDAWNNLGADISS